MMGQYLAAMQQFLILIWFFLTDKPAAEALTAEQPPDTQTLRLRRRWERSKERARRQQKLRKEGRVVSN